MFQLFYLVLILNLFLIIFTFDFKKVCYLRTDPTFEIPVKLIIESQFCSHLIIGFASVDDNSMITTDPNDVPFFKECKSKINELNSNTLLLLSVGGGGNDNGFHSAVSNDFNRKKFTDSAIELIEKHGFDGIDLDWEFPAWGNFYFADKQYFNLLLKELREGFSRYESNVTNNKKLLISVAVAAQRTITYRSYDVPEMVKYIDFINLMTYDFHLYHWYWPFAGHNSPLFKNEFDLGLFATMNVEYSANFWNQLGANKNQIIVGIPTYARSYRLAFKWWTIPGALAIADNGDMTYSQVCEFLQSNDTKIVFDPEARVPYAYDENIWISYENERSTAKKVEWIKDNGFGGVMTFSLNADDYKYKCSKDKLFVIHSVIKSLTLS